MNNKNQFYAGVMLKASRKKYVLSDRRNERCESMALKSGVWEFQIEGSGTENALFPNCVLVHSTTAALDDDDQGMNR